MRIAFCLFKYFPFGGLQRDFLRIAQACLARGHVIDVYTLSWEGQLEPGLAIHVISVKSLTNHQRRLDYIRQVTPFLQAGHYDAVVGFNKMPGLDVYFAADTCYQSRARAQHGWWYRLTRRYRHTVALEKAVFDPAANTTILLIAPRQQAEFSRYYDTPAERFHVLPPGIARDRAAPGDALQQRQRTRAEYGIKPKDFLLLSVGSGFKTKGLDRTLIALAALPPELKSRTRLFVIGEDNARRYQRQAARLRIDAQVHFLGGRLDVPRFLLAADILLHPAYHENTGTVLLEALISGLPSIVSEVCGYAHYIHDAAAGIVIPSPFQQERFNHALTNMLSFDDIRAAARNNALGYAQHADIYQLPERAVSLIESFSLR